MSSGATAGMGVRFWGVRGSVPTPDPAMLGYGGNTPTVQLEVDDGPVLIIDGGTGLYPLGQMLVADQEPRPIHLFLSHFHWDHIQGIPAFAPIYESGHELVVHAPSRKDGARGVLARQMSDPFFPIDFQEVAGSCRVVENDGEPVQVGEALVRPFPLNHPQGATGYRVEAAGGSVVYASDTEHGHPELDDVLRRVSEGCDLLIYDAHYTPGEYEERRGWGHSHWRAGVGAARDSGAGRLVLFHHDPGHDDGFLDAVAHEARKELPSVVMAREGQTLPL